MKTFMELLMSSWKTNCKLFFMMVLSICIVSCGGDDNDDGGNSSGGEKTSDSGYKLVDGVNVANGKKIKELRIKVIGEGIHSYSMDYDAKGRLHKIYTYSSNTPYEIASFDYDLRTATIMKINYIFTLNDAGFISQIGFYTLNYNSDGYLIGVDQPYGNSSLLYANNDLTKALTVNFNANRTTTYFCHYGQDTTNGELVIFVNSSSPLKKRVYEESGYQAKVISLIAYQSGLLGKIVKQCLYLKDSSETSALFEYHRERDETEIRFSFVCE